jgi:DNA-binding NarL/FixJ family response regulator
MLVVVADRHPLFREVLRGLVDDLLPGACCLEAGSVADVLDLLAAGQGVGLLLVDQALPDGDGLAGMVRLSIAAPDIPLVLFSPVDGPAARFQALVCGAAGFIAKSLTRPEMLRALSAATGLDPAPQGPRNRPRIEVEERVDVLTLRERMVLEALVRGCSNKQIAYELQVSDTTVKVHVSSVLRKLRVHSRTQVVIRTRRVEDGSIRPASP